MKRGIYIMANDAVIDNTITLLNSIRLFDPGSPVIMIPYDDKYKKLYNIIKPRLNVGLFEDLGLVESIQKKVESIFGRKLFPRVNQFRKQASWFGPFDEFLYLDTDILVFEKVIDNLKYFADHDFICADYQYKLENKYLFTGKIKEIFGKNELRGVFNAGFWGSKKGMITEKTLFETFEECARHLEYFDLSQGVSDMPIFNYLVLKNIKRQFNLVRDTGEKGPGCWAGMPHFKREGNILIDPNVNKPLMYLHWAGIKIAPGCPYWDMREHYRNLMI
jgi:hypothetical protein